MPQDQEFRRELAYSSKLAFRVLEDLRCWSEVKSNQYKNNMVIVPLRAKQIN